MGFLRELLKHTNEYKTMSRDSRTLIVSVSQMIVHRLELQTYIPVALTFFIVEFLMSPFLDLVRLCSLYKCQFVKPFFHLHLEEKTAFYAFNIKNV